jgi:hypothetical protein
MHLVVARYVPLQAGCDSRRDIDHSERRSTVFGGYIISQIREMLKLIDWIVFLLALSAIVWVLRHTTKKSIRPPMS